MITLLLKVMLNLRKIAFLLNNLKFIVLYSGTLVMVDNIGITYSLTSQTYTTNGLYYLSITATKIGRYKYTIKVLVGSLY
jgi:hypothetical protein